MAWWSRHSPAEHCPSTMFPPVQVAGEQRPVRSTQAPLWHWRQVPMQPGPFLPLAVGWQRKAWQLVQGPHSLSLQQAPAPPGTHSPLHSSLSGGQRLSQAAFSATQLSRQGFFPVGQETPHFCPSQVACPPWMPGHG
jgi:hypothetical protein